MSLTNTFETTTLTWLLTAGSATRPTAWYIGLYTTAPTDVGGGTEVSGGSYVREASTFVVSGDTASNNAAIEWPTATDSWGVVVAAGIFDASVGGNLIAYGNLNDTKNITTGDVFRISSGNLDVTLD
tara:strand:- start:348 stop:728 length:381 start_codon:yes stop_codon:yes gene_type:complete